MNIKNEIAFLPGDVVPPFGANVNLPPTRREGFEVEADWNANAWLAFSANYTYAVAKFLEGSFGGADVTDKNVPARCRGIVPALARPSHPWSVCAVTALFTYVGEQYYDNDQSNTFGRKIPEYTVVDVAANYDYRNWTLSASIHNLLGEDLLHLWHSQPDRAYLQCLIRRQSGLFLRRRVSLRPLSASGGVLVGERPGGVGPFSFILLAGSKFCYCAAMQQMTSTQLYLRLLRYVQPYWGVFAFSILGMLITAGTESFCPLPSSLSSMGLSSRRIRF
jgi:hypothetical protein